MASGTITGTTANKYITSRIVWTATANTDTNSSSVTATLSYKKSSSSTDKTYGSYSGKLNIGGYSKAFSKTITLNNNDSWVTIGSLTATIAHNADGTKSITISATGGISSTSFTSTSCSDTVMLDNIPRATTPTTSGTFNVGSSVTINTPRASNSFTHTVQYSLNNSSWTNIATGVTTSTTWTLPAALATAKTNATSGTVYIRCITYNGSTNLGNKVISRTYNITSSYASPSVAIAVSQTNDANIAQYIRGCSSVKLTATGTFRHGASAKKYVFKYGGQEKIATTTASTANFTFTLPSNAAASFAYSVTVTDSRGFTATKSGTITTVAYTGPVITSLVTARGNYDGTTFAENNKGNSLRIVAAGTVTSLSNANAKNYRIEYRKSNDTTYTTLIESKAASSYAVAITEYTDALFSENASYVLRFTLIDSFGSVSQIVDVPSQKVLLNFSANGKAMAIGGIATLDDVLEIMLESYMTGGIKPMQLANGTDFNEIVKTGMYIGNAASGDYVNAPVTTGTFILEVTSAGSEGQLMQRYSYCNKTTYRAWVRFYYQSTWGEWQPAEGFTAFNTTGYAGQIRLANGFMMQWGRISIAPDTANVTKSVDITYPIAFTHAPIVHAHVHTSAPAVVSVSASVGGVNGMTIYLTRSNTTAGWVSWIAIGRG